MENFSEHTDELIARFLGGNATETEKEEIGHWRKASAQNEKYFKDLEFIFHKTKTMQTGRQVDTEKAWNKIAGEIHAKDHARIFPLKKADTPYFFYKIAASILLVFGIAAAAYKFIPATPSIAISSGNTSVRQNLPDGSEVIVKAHGELTSLNDHRGAREYRLSGEAHFKISHDEKTPFIIHTGEAMIRDIGTSFSVKAYDKSDSIEVCMESGTVQLYTRGMEGIILTGNEKGIYFKSTGIFKKETSATAKDLQFANVPLSEVIQKLNSTFGSHIELANEKIGTCRITVRFNGENLNEIIDIIAQTLNLKISKGNKTIVLYGEGCE